MIDPQLPAEQTAAHSVRSSPHEAVALEKTHAVPKGPLKRVAHTAKGSWYRRPRFWVLSGVVVASVVSYVYGKVSPWIFIHSAEIRSLNARKYGTVIDISTQVPLAGAVVVVTGLYHGTLSLTPSNALAYFAGQHTNVDGRLFRVVVLSDAQGHFEVPETTAESWAALHNPRWHGESYTFSGTWNLQTFKVGFSTVGDDIATEFDAYDDPVSRGPVREAAERQRQMSPPPYAESHQGLAISPIKMQPLSTSLKAEIYYYAHSARGIDMDRVGYANRPDPQSSGGPFPIADALQRELRTYLVAKICALESSEELGFAEVVGMAYLSPDSQKDLEALRRLEPDGFQSYMTYAMVKGSDQKAKYLAADVCTALSGDGISATKEEKGTAG